MKILLSPYLILALSLAPSMASASPQGAPCGTFPPTHVVSAPQTIEQIERQEMAEIAHWRKFREDLPNVPFGFGNAEWVAFKKAVKRGDQIVRCRSSDHSWQHLAGQSGLALVRTGCIVKNMVTLVN